MEGDAAYEVQLRTLARDLGIDDRVIFTGERADVPDLLAAADVAVHCSVDPEPFGLVILEAMAAGRAVIASNAGGPAEIIEAGNSGLLTRPGDHSELGEAMLRVLTDRELRGRLARNGAARLESRFSFHRMASDLTSILHGISGGRRLPGAAGSELSRRAQ